MLKAAFAALKHRNYRLLWIGTLLSNTGDRIDQLALNWLVYDMTGSAYYLALVNLCRGIPMVLFTLLGGAFADRTERRAMMLITQSCAMVLALLLAGIVATGSSNIWAVLLVAAGRGAVVAFNMPTRHSMIGELVPREDMANAVALNSLTMNMTKIVGPALAGLIISTLGTLACFLINAVSFVFVLATLVAMRFPPAVVDPAAAPRRNIWRSILEGFAYIRQDRTVMTLLLIAMVPTFFGQSFVTLLVVFVQEVFFVGPEGLGLLTSCVAVGSVLGAFAMAARSRRLIRGVTMMRWLLAFGAALLAFGYNTSFLIAPLILAVAGMAQVTYSATNNTLLQLRLPDQLRGRVMSIMLLNRALVPLGGATAATLSQHFGPGPVMICFGGLIIVFAGLILLFYPPIGRITG